MNLPAAWERTNLFNTQVLSSLERNTSAKPVLENQTVLQRDTSTATNQTPAATQAAQLNFAFFAVNFPHKYSSPQQPLFKVGLSVFSPLCFHFIKCSHLQRGKLFSYCWETKAAW